ncbi:sulfur carrier protein ThiS [Dictyobacter kobayashii]|uniref:Thiamine biosynthesis protein ThiS n=1 Tax=Dictyobacter kobayashii TaxID=2014872 RepID=A0A402AF51_9CHLR|nr:sulfur carrier protein ThiS [Dictyobacter kobayashii]GCE17692.1 hypothetical protein KDK_14920 [Dictyobacter kobayashii]
MEEVPTDAAVISILTNGQPRSIARGSSVEELLQLCNVKAVYVVVQLDGEIIARSAFAHTVLEEGNKVEIITLAGGG